MTGQLDLLARYLGTRARQRQEARERLLEGFTERERRLIREAAVMGYVQGVRCGPHRDKIPPDSQILEEVVDACMSNADLYPVLTGYSEPADD